MIIRELLTNPKLLGSFDFFNDFDDTRGWLLDLHTRQANALAERLAAHYDVWFDRRNTQYAQDQLNKSPAGQLLIRYGFRPWDTESSARRVAERAATDIQELVDALEALLVQSPSTSEALPAIRSARKLINKHRT